MDIDHPAVTPGVSALIAKGGQRSAHVEVTCPNCRVKRWVPARFVRYGIETESFSGLCKPCWQEKNRDPRTKELPKAHPAVDLARLERRSIYGVNTMAAPVTCPTCRTERWWPLFVLKQQIKRDNFFGYCRPCGQRASREGTFQTKTRNGRGRRSIHRNGYIQLGPTSVDAADLPMFRAMQNRNRMVFEHRWVMAKLLGRPLRSNECVDHRDGNKTNNDPNNLRIYLRGKNQEGSANGYGTYYHEWQIALRRIVQLEAQLTIVSPDQTATPTADRAEVTRSRAPAP